MRLILVLKGFAFERSEAAVAIERSEAAVAIWGAEPARGSRQKLNQIQAKLGNVTRRKFRIIFVCFADFWIFRNSPQSSANIRKTDALISSIGPSLRKYPQIFREKTRPKSSNNPRVKFPRGT